MSLNDIDVISLFHGHVATASTANLGEMVSRMDIKSSVAPFHFFPEYRIKYPETVTQALGELYLEYNRTFAPLVETNREWRKDYQYCEIGGHPANWVIQVDMVGMPDSFLRGVTAMRPEIVREILRSHIFEIENSVAMYQLLQQGFANGQPSHFDSHFRQSLDDLRKRFDKPIALLAVTNEKYNAMKAVEFGKGEDEPLSDQEVFALSGFDKFLNPKQFMDHVTHDGGDCRYLLYARTSDPVEKLKHPEFVVDQPLLGDPKIRRIIKEHSLTMNIDDPTWTAGDPRRINDSKMYMPSLGMGFRIINESSMLSSAFERYIAQGNNPADFDDPLFSSEFVNYLRSQGVQPESVEWGQKALRCKPARGAYGCYGHVRGVPSNATFRKELRRNLRQRGDYIIQPELATPCVVNAADGIEYTFIDRNFLSVASGKPRFLGGFRSLLPVDSVETQSGRNHGNSSCVAGEIVA